MIELVNLKQEVLKGLIDKWKELEKVPSFTSLPHYNTIGFEIPSINLKSLLTFCDQETPLFYWANRSHKKEFLGINSIHQIGNKEFLPVIEDIVQENLHSQK